MQDCHLLYTIGHSSLEAQALIKTLHMYRLSALADVRSRPQSHRHPQYNQSVLEGFLQDEGIQYLFLGEELGGRPDDPKAYREDGLVDYRARRASRGFQQGIERVLAELQSRSLVLMCAEEDPLECHRFLMVTPALLEHGVEIVHIRRGGVLEPQRDAEDRLLQEQRWGAAASNALFERDRAAALDAAYLAQAEKCAFRTDPKTVEYWY
jgi:uncharacterized protein (DUF488 family)